MNNTHINLDSNNKKKRQKHFFKLKYVQIIIFFIGGILLLLIGFSCGMKVGTHKAKFSYQWGENYERNFLGPKPVGPFQIMPEFEQRGFRNPHGLAGIIISISGNTIVVKDNENKENTISVTDKTTIQRFTNTFAITDLKINDRIVVLGKPGENGVVIADFIRIF